MIGPADERARALESDEFADAVTFSFADTAGGLFGFARLGLTRSGASALAVLFRGREPIAAVARGGLAAPEAADWAALDLEVVRTATRAPLESWTIGFDDEAGSSFELDFDAASAPAELAPRLGGMAGYEQICRVTGTVRTGGETLRVDGLGQRGHSWGAPDWSRLELARTIGAWLADAGGGLAYASVRPAGAAGHSDEDVQAVLVRQGEPVPVADPRLSTTYDGEGRQRRAGLELWVGDEDDYPHRATGQVLCGSTLDLGQLRLDVAFFAWSIDGRPGVGRYDVLRRAAG